MAVIKLKYSLVTSQPADDSLQVGEPAYSYVSDRLFIGEDNNGTIEAKIIGGQYYTDMLNHTKGTLTASSAIVVDANKHIDEIIAGGLTLTTSGGTGHKVTSISTDLTTDSASTSLLTANAAKTYVDNEIDGIALSDISDVTFTAPVGGQLVIYNNSTSEWENKTLTGDVTIGANGVTDITASGVTAGSYGSATAIPTFTVASDGRLTAASSVSIATTLNVVADAGTGDGVDLLTDNLSIVGTGGIDTSINGDTVTINLAAGSIANDRLANSTFTITDGTASDDVALGETLTFTGGTGLTTSVTANDVTITLNDTAVTTGTYGSTTQIPVITVDQQGRITSASFADIATTLTIVGDDSDSTTIDLLSEGLTIAGGTGLSTSVDDATAPNIITVSMDDTAVTAGNYGSSSKIPTFTVDAQGRLTAAGEADIATALRIGADSGLTNDDVNNGTVALAGDTLTFVGGTGLSTVLADNSVTFNLDDTAVTAGTYGGLTGNTVAIPTFTVDAQGRLTAASTTGLDVRTFANVQVTDTDSGFSWAETGTVVADNNNSTIKYVSGTGININADTGSDAIRIENTGVVTLAGTNHISVSNTGTDYTVTSDATDANTASTIVARDASGNFSAGKASLTEAQIDNININGNIITSTDTNGNIQLTPDGAGIVDITKDTNISGDVTISGDLTVTGSTTQTNLTELVIDDPLVHLAAGNETSDSVDIGWIGHYSPDGGTTKQHCGFFRNHNDGKFYFFEEYLDDGLDDGTTTDIDVNDASFVGGTIYADTVIANIEGIADYADELTTARTISLSGDVVGSVLFKGDQDVTISTTIQPNSVVLGTDTTGNYVATLANSNGGLTITNSGQESAAVSIELDVTHNTFKEGAQDAVGEAISNGSANNQNITVTYDDNANAISAAVATASRTVLGVAKFGSQTDDGEYVFGFDANGHVELLVVDGGTF